MSTQSLSSSKLIRPRGRILVIDDEHNVLTLAIMMLESQGFEVIGTESGEIGVEIFLKSEQTDQPINMVILDLTMPNGLSGFEVLDRLLAISPNLPIIACSGYFQEDARELCQSIGFADVLQKPYAPEHLFDVVRRQFVRERTLT